MKPSAVRGLIVGGGILLGLAVGFFVLFYMGEAIGLIVGPVLGFLFSGIVLMAMEEDHVPKSEDGENEEKKATE